jgi:glycosyltransferase involved in cell wall biosynthesis
LRVLFVSHSAGLAGAEHSLLRLLDGLDRRLISPVVLLSGHGDLEDALRRRGTPILRAHYAWWVSRRNHPFLFTLRMAWNLAHLPRLALAVARLKPDLVYTNSIVVPQGAFVARLLSVPHVWHVRELLDNPTMQSPIPDRWILQLVAEWSCTVVAVSKCVAAQFQSLGESKAHVAVISNAVPLSNEAAVSELERAARYTERRAAACFQFVVAGAISRSKGTFDAIRVVELLRTEWPRVRLIVAGDGEPRYRRSLERYVREHRLEATVTFVGHTTHLDQLLRSSEILLMPAMREAFGLVTIEALSVGTPVVGVDDGGTSEVLAPGGGVVVPPGRIDLLASAVILMLKDKFTYLEYSRAALRRSHDFRATGEAAAVQHEILRAARGRN